MIEIMLWWMVITVTGLIALPLARRFFRSYPDQGYILSKAFGLCLLSFVNWILSSLHILKFSPLSVLVSMSLILLGSWFLKKESLADIGQFFTGQKRVVWVSEIVFLAAFALFAFIRMCNPDIASTEKMPDFAFLTGIINSGYFPPKDPWFLGETINYFYYGHYQIALLTKLTGIAPQIGFNLGIAFLFAITLTTAFGVTYGLTRNLKYGFLGGLFVAFIGNLDGINQLLSKVVLGPEKFYPFTWFNWWMSSRVIVREGVDITINEFPFWSYILGDLHAHVNVVPFSLLVLGIILELMRGGGDGLGVIGRGKEFYFRIIIAAVALGAIPAANTWDMPTYFGLMAAALIFERQFTRKFPVTSYLGFLLTPFRELIDRWNNPPELTKDRNGSLFWSRWGLTLTAVFLLIGIALLLYCPYYQNFQPKGTQGIRLVDPIQRTLWDDFLTIYGFFFFCVLSLILYLLKERIMKVSPRLMPLLVGSLITGYIITFLVFQTFMVAFCIIVLGLLLALPFSQDDPEKLEKFFALSLFATALLILLGCEFFYIKDAYGKTLERQNTIFKFYYQAWVFCGISSAYAVYRFSEIVKERWKLTWDMVYRVLFVATLAFPVFGTTVKCNHFAALKDNTPYAKATLDGIWYMSWRYKGDYQTIQYLRKHAKPEETVLEATGPAFSHYGRISASTGMYTLIGWANHENIWRDGSWQMVNKRVNDVRTIYSTSDINLAGQLLNEYGIDYVYVGMLEREQYPNADFDKFASFMTKLLDVEDSDGKMTYLYRANPQSSTRED
ncbi:hypothetical protein JXA40_09135 [bacterium]|nr:hypothetical protein [candidate division CSSED10-310 bacterium]